MKTFTVGELAARAGIATSAVRFYEERGLIRSQRTSANHRRYRADALRRVSFVLAAQRVGLTLTEIATVLDQLPDGRTPTAQDWARLAAAWRPRLDEQIATLERLRDTLDGCIGCGCLSLDTCALWNPGDAAATLGAGPRYVVAAERPDLPAS